MSRILRIGIGLLVIVVALYWTYYFIREDGLPVDAYEYGAFTANLVSTAFGVALGLWLVLTCRRVEKKPHRGRKSVLRVIAGVLLLLIGSIPVILFPFAILALVVGKNSAGRMLPGFLNAAFFLYFGILLVRRPRISEPDEPGSDALPLSREEASTD